MSRSVDPMAHTTDTQDQGQYGEKFHVSLFS
jgi:hypothetical protein